MAIKQKELVKGLTEVLKVAATQPTLPILGGVQIESKAGVLSLTCTDLEQYLTVTLQAPGLPNGLIIVKGKDTLNILRTFPDADINIVFEPKALNFVSGRIGAKVVTDWPNGDWPLRPKLFQPIKFAISSDVLVKSIGCVKDTVVFDENRPNLNGIFFTVEPVGKSSMGKLALVTTDTRRLSRYQSESLVPNGIDFILPIASAELILNLFREPGFVEVNVSLQKPTKETGTQKLAIENVVFTDGRRELLFRAIEGTFPDYKSVVPKDDKFPLVTLPAKQVMDSLKRISVLVSKGKNFANIKVDKNVLTLSGIHEGTTISETFDVVFPWNLTELNFNPEFLIDGIKSTGTDNFTMLFNPDPTGEKPSAIKPDSTAGEYIYLIMPLRY